MDSQQAAFEKFKAAGGGRKFTHEMRNAEDYGAFVQIPGFKRHGLVFKNQASKHFTQHISDVVAVGDQVWVKVTSTQDNKIALSMKYVNQGDGRDLGKYKEQDKKRVHPGFMDKKPIAIEEGGVLLKTVCKKCGAAGHLATECFSGGEKFALLEDEDGDDVGDQRGARSTRVHSGDKEKKKKDKHESKNKDRHRDRSRDRDRHRHSEYNHSERESRRDHNNRSESSSHRKDRKRDRSKSPSEKRRSDGPRVSKVESLEDALAVMRARK
ncbi:Nucleolar protein of 40 kDa, partial [Entomortierella lignicola]